ncbi:valine--tRNA ligase [Candidatus Falkowbacteria bacterium]|jgi:valyl-tRNA synthetase|nr:valine--tRNA ligase [Candidatus Falkowbacteria bacterium]
MKKELEKAYNPGENEDKIYQKWEKSGYFNPDNLNLPADAKSYTIVLPPPNITAKLHIGHSCMLAIEDLLIRYHRMAGYRTLWLPGTDHAAIATQMAVEKKIFTETGKTRHDLGREKLLEEIWNFLYSTQAAILHQTRKMGSSLDWSREAFTLDKERQRAVNRMFIDMYREGVIYRGERIVNWCPHCHSTLADDEVEYKEQHGKLYTFKYSPEFPMAISTTRPETKLGDTAVAVNPKDKRYQKYIGQEYQVNFCGQPLNIKIIADRKVESDFGTGALGVTPAHSMVDWQMAEANNLSIVKVINEDGLIHQGFGKYSGLTAEAARQLIIEELKKQGLMEKEEDLVNNLSICYRCDTPIEPLPSKQWFVSVDKKLARLGGQSLKEKALEAAQTREITFIPERFNKRYQNWMENLHDWCISRQIWFGHEIPVWYRGEEIYCGETAPTGDGWIKDDNTLDTWFSSGMWTFSTLGWPDNYQNGVKTGDLKKFHPTQVLETGYDILTLWVSRMIMMSFFALDEVPFSQVYLHGTILDEKGKKMSKSKGNGVDPLDAITEYGADALRLSLLMGSTPGNDTRYSTEKIEAKRNFINKLWNIARFILNSTEEKYFSTPADQVPAAQTLFDQWILGEMNNLIKSVTVRLENFEFSLAAEELDEFTWNKLADWYLEVAKVEKNKEEILIYLLKNLLILWHPFIPFVTEAIWESFNDSLLMITAWPQATDNLEDRKMEVDLVKNIIIAIRNARSEHKIEPAKKLTAVIYGHKLTKVLNDQAEIIKNLRTGIESLEIKESGEDVEKAIIVPVGEITIYLIGLIDEVKEKERLLKEQANLEKLIDRQIQKLNNSDFVSRAPEKIVTAEKEKLNNYQQELAKITNIITSL